MPTHNRPSPEPLTESIDIARSPESVYAVVSDVTRTGEWSPICQKCWWDDADERGAGAWFTGRNVIPERTWETRSQVETAEPGREFAWRVGPAEEPVARWGYLLEPIEGGTRLTETWKLLPGSTPFFTGRYGDDADDVIAERAEMARTGIAETLAAIKRITEAN
ncbi:SRPBCC family protein [Streptomyces sp. SL13]|uniref:SRPBCC family protein n=1 Tax=Streptantibioticus silvisoli TaxID=2705255 RepID=A0AA90H5Z0_9ACTN|nr:SRPBCC family protein [Streptantibioticus silvisoli]MDI5971027.1 SRPBCC family protein [Streptantibioticus silvisoli]